MSTCTVGIGYPSASDEIWNYVSFPSSIDTTSGNTLVIRLDGSRGTWEGSGLHIAVYDWVEIFDRSSEEYEVSSYSIYDDGYEFEVELEPGFTTPIYVYVYAEFTEIPKLKIKKFFEKITTAIKGIDEIGQGAEIYGKNSAGTGDCSLAKQTYKNPLAGQCSGRLYTEGGTCTTATTTTQSNDLFVVTPSTGKIKVLKTAQYLVAAKVFGYTGFTAEDRLDTRVQINGSNNAILFARERMSGIYQMICLTRMLTLNANDEINLAVTNYEAARGLVVTTSSTMLQVIKLGDY